MSEPNGTENPPRPLVERFDKYRAEIEQIVTRGIEHPNYELKRSASISRENLSERLDFVKLIQGLANAHSAEERFIVIGADQRERKGYEVTNAEEFDPAKLAQVIAKYIDPLPRMEVFNNARTEGGEVYVFIVLGADQHRPVVSTAEGTSGSRTHFRCGDIWIKKDTSLQLVTRSDLDAIYEQRISEEAETRARRRFQHFREEFGASFAAQPSTTGAPSAGLLVGDRTSLRSFAEFVIATADHTRLKMILELAGERLVEEWIVYQADVPITCEDVDSRDASIVEFLRDGFTPALESVVELGLQVIKFDGPDVWLKPVVELLIESFEMCREAGNVTSGPWPSTRWTSWTARSAFDIYIGVRTLATYAVLRKRYRFLREILPKFVVFFSLNSQRHFRAPVTFWPFSSSLDFPNMREGRNRTFWKERIEASWAHYFARPEHFLAAAAQLEFILEFNSYIVADQQNPEVHKLRQNLLDKDFDYEPDFWATRLDPTVFVAEQFYDALAGKGLPDEFVIEPKAIEAVFNGKTPRERLVFLGGFLSHLQTWQAQAMRQFNRFPFSFEWPSRLADLKKAFAASKATQ